MLAKGGWDFELIDELKPLAQDIVIEKPRYSGFFNTALDSMLRSRGIRNLVFVGIATNVCGTTLRVFFRNFGLRVMPVIRQGRGRRMKLVYITLKPFFGWVSDTANFVETFQIHSNLLEKSA